MKTKAILAIIACFLVPALTSAQGGQQPQQPMADKQTPVTAIPGVIAAGAKFERLWTGQRSADGVIGEPDGTVLLLEQRAHRVSRVSNDGKITLWLEDTNETGGIAIDPKGRYISVERMLPRVRELHPQRRVIADTFEGKPIGRLADIVGDTKGGVYITELPTSSVIYINPAGQLARVGPDIPGANGIMLSPDERTLYVTNTQAGILAFDVQPDGSLRNRRPFAKPEGGQDGLAVDAAGRLYIASDLGVQVYSPQGQHLGLIPTPREITSIAFAGPQKRTLYLIGRGHSDAGGGDGDARSLYRIPMTAEGFKGRAK
jgi:gluconolactonase